MRAIRASIALLAFSVTACSAGSLTNTPVGRGLQPASVVTVSGFVESYSERDVRLLSGGYEIQLSGAIESVIPFGGLEVRLIGRRTTSGGVWVEEVHRVHSRPVAATSTASR
jgi:hypothetical protein